MMTCSRTLSWLWIFFRVTSTEVRNLDECGLYLFSLEQISAVCADYVFLYLEAPLLGYHGAPSPRSFAQIGRNAIAPVSPTQTKNALIKTGPSAPRSDPNLPLGLATNSSSPISKVRK